MEVEGKRLLVEEGCVVVGEDSSYGSSALEEGIEVEEHNAAVTEL